MRLLPFGPMTRNNCCRRGSTHVVVRVLWSTKYGLPSGVNLCSHPAGRGPEPWVVVPLAACAPVAPAAAAAPVAPGVFDPVGVLPPPSVAPRNSSAVVRAPPPVRAALL